MNNKVLVSLASFFPIFALSYVFIYPLYIDFDIITDTHCHNANVLPSVSAAISYTSLTALVWLFCIALHTPLRVLLARRVFHVYKRIFGQIFEPEKLAKLTQNEVKYFVRLRRGVLFAYQFNLTEIAGLLVLSIFPSMTSFEWHKAGFGIFLISSAIFTILILLIEKQLDRHKLPNCYALKKRLAQSYFLSFLLAIITYYWHNAYCTNYVYSFFGFFEVVLITSNVAQHASAIYILDHADIRSKFNV